MLVIVVLLAIVFAYAFYNSENSKVQLKMLSCYYIIAGLAGYAVFVQVIVNYL